MTNKAAWVVEVKKERGRKKGKEKKRGMREGSERKRQKGLQKLFAGFRLGIVLCCDACSSWPEIPEPRENTQNEEYY